MSSLFNRTFFNFTIGFMAILLMAFVVAVVVSTVDQEQKQQELAEYEAARAAQTFR